MPEEHRIQLRPAELVFALAPVVDLVSPVIANHHLRVSYIAGRIATEAGFSSDEVWTLTLAGALHDIGALTVQERLDTLAFETDETSQHCELGYRLLRVFEPFSDIAQLVRTHHVPWRNGKSKDHGASLLSHVLHLADRAEVLIDRKTPLLEQAPSIVNHVSSCKGTWFVPEFVDAFRKVASQDSFWLDLEYRHLDRLLLNQQEGKSRHLKGQDVIDICKMFSHVIDFRSPFTATHSSGVAAVAEAMAESAGFSSEESSNMRLAGYLHDLGKVAVPNTILEKPGALDDRQILAMRGHTYFTRRILEQIAAFREISVWASNHHERLDGSGYPFGLSEKDLSWKSRLMAVADTFTAIAEERPYKSSIPVGKTIGILSNLVGNNALDGEAVDLVAQDAKEIDELRVDAQRQAHASYLAFKAIA